MRRVVVVDSDPDCCKLVAESLAELVDVEGAHTWEVALRMARGPDTLAVLWSDDSNDRTALRHFLAGGGVPPRPRVFVMSSSFTVDRVIELFREGISGLLKGPLSGQLVMEVIGQYVALRTRQSHYLVKRMDKHLEDNCSKTDLCMATVAARFGVSPGYVGRLFREQFGTRFRQRLTEIRVARAKDLLSQTNYPISAVAKDCGFRNPSRLSESFRRQTGLAPRAFRYRARSQEGGVGEEENEGTGAA